MAGIFPDGFRRKHRNLASNARGTWGGVRGYVTRSVEVDAETMIRLSRIADHYEALVMASERLNVLPASGKEAELDEWLALLAVGWDERTKGGE